MKLLQANKPLLTSHITLDKFVDFSREYSSTLVNFSHIFSTNKVKYYGCHDLSLACRSGISCQKIHTQVMKSD